MLIRNIYWLLFTIFFLLNCCGYSTQALIAPHLKTIAIPLVENQTIRPGLEEALTEKLTEDFNKDRHLRITSIENADVVLECQITGYNKIPQSYDADQNVYAYRITIDATGRCEDRVTSDIIWEGPVSAWITYDPNAESEETGIEKALAKLSLEIVRKTITSW
ncbi:MAG: LptE family protein [bacterium]|nr:LPS assembly lipoprotein LptE [candidate division WOR-3 bacterium]MDH5684434.1 LPS assembly lipoprotein LptE [candidate division WOR-3 bacterium]